MGTSRTLATPYYANFSERRLGEVRRIPLPCTPANKESGTAAAAGATVAPWPPKAPAVSSSLPPTPRPRTTPTAAPRRATTSPRPPAPVVLGTFRTPHQRDLRRDVNGVQ